MSDRLTVPVRGFASFNEWIGWEFIDCAPSKLAGETAAYLVPLAEYRRLKRIEKAARLVVRQSLDSSYAVAVVSPLIEPLQPLKEKRKHHV